MAPTPRALSRAVGLLLAAACLLPVAPAHGATAVSRSFFGTVVDGPMLDPDAPIENELSVMRQTGLGTVRLPVHWAAVQPYPSWDVVPAGERADFTDIEGVPTDVRALDRWVKGAARLGMEVLPTVLRSPWWAARNWKDEASPPKGTTEYARLMTGLVKRYGPAGSIWAGGGAKLPIRDWQIWNEPSITLFWNWGVWAHDYVALLRDAGTAVKAVDPGARIVLGGLPNDSWNALERVYYEQGKGLFDVVALHPYTQRVNNVLEVVRRARQVMDSRGDRATPIMITEMGWSSGAGKQTNRPTWETSEAGQAAKLSAVVKALTRRRAELRIEGMYWYTWLSADDGFDSFTYSGLRRKTASGIVSKPALTALRTTVRELSKKKR
ncbi:MAG TPA: hypothetical protein VN238_09315 [Solirubrobacteraceae bacterium]|nr:hypothetical protein [Solirubrobacteraceae bacterium]